jgi:DNA repair ATPase RecN
MNGKTFIIASLRRLRANEPPETLEFEPGVNLIFGAKDTGKTKWLSMLDFVLGDNGSAQDAFGTELADKYDIVAADLTFSDGSEITLERKWKLQGTKGKIFVNDSPMDADDFGDFLLKRLDIPNIRFPKGSPWNDRTWPKLSWRTLFRSM